MDVLYAAVKPEADAKGVTDEEFGRAMSGDAIEMVTTALLDKVINFFPETRRKVFRKILDATRRFKRFWTIRPSTAKSTRPSLS